MVYYDRLCEYVVRFNHNVSMKKYYFGPQLTKAVNGKPNVYVDWGEGHETAEKAVIANADRVNKLGQGVHLILGCFDDTIF